MSIFCLIPAYNENGNLLLLTERLVFSLKKTGLDFKIFYVLQGNKQSEKIAANLKKKYPFLDYTYHPQPLGVGKAYQIGFQKTDEKFTHILTMDADLNHDPHQISKFIAKMKKDKCDVVVGSRFSKGGEFSDKRTWKRISSMLINFSVSAALGIKVKDLTSGYRLIKREVVQNVAEKLKEEGYPSYMEFILLTLRSGYKICEIPIKYSSRRWGVSKMRKIPTSIDYLRFLPKILTTSFN